MSRSLKIFFVLSQAAEKTGLYGVCTSVTFSPLPALVVTEHGCWVSTRR